jgi:cysteine desulfurase
MEHHSNIVSWQLQAQKRGIVVKHLLITDDGRVCLDSVETYITERTKLISIAHVSNVLGTVNPVEEIIKVAHEHGIYFHTDAVQAFGHLPIDVNEMNIDLMSASGHKINGPKGIGLLYIRKGVKITNLIHGGAQESGKRAGTTNAAGIIGFAKATELAVRDMEETRAYESRLRDKLIAGVTAEIPYTRVNGDLTNRLSNNVNFCFRFIEGESLLIMLDQKGICASSGSACTSGSLDPSHVLLAIGLTHEIAHGSLRLTLSKDTTEEDIDYVVESLKQIVGRLRMMSPLYEDFLKKNKEASA